MNPDSPQIQPSDQQGHDQTPNPTPTPTLPSKTEEEVKAELTKIIENVFTKEYISTDPFILSKMTQDHFIPFNVIEELEVVKKVTDNSLLIHEIIRASSKVEVDNEKKLAKPVANLNERTTIILRDVPEGTTAEEVKEIFKDNIALQNSIKEMKPDHANTFFIRFNSENEAYDALPFIRTQKLKGQDIHARMKTENIFLKSYYYGPAQTPPYISYEPYDQQYNNYNNQHYSDQYRPNHDRKSRPYQKKKAYRGGGGGGRKGLGGNGINHASVKKSGPKENRKAAPYTLTNWPPLPMQSENKNSYKDDFIKYPKQTVVAIINSIKEDNKPEIPDCPAVAAEKQSELESTKLIPTNTKLEWIDQPRSRKGSANTRKPNINYSKNDTKIENENRNDNNKESSSIPVGAWQSDSASVKTPPTQQQQKNQQRPKPNNPKKKKKQPPHQQHHQPKQYAKAKQNQESQVASGNVSGEGGVSTGSALPGGSGGSSESSGLSYADIARSVPNVSE